MIDRDVIKSKIDTMHEAENDPSLTPTQKAAVIDTIMHDDATGWLNGASRGARSTERGRELMLYETFPDYHRRIDRLLIDPPRAAFDWYMTGTSDELGIQLELHGCSIMEFGDDGRARRFWLYLHDPLQGAESGEPK